MGMPITSYKVLRLLADPATANGEGEKKLHDTLAKFRLVGVILHDPTRNHALHDILTSQFERLDRITGKHILFFAVVEVSSQWRASAKHRHYFSIVEKMLNIGYAYATPTPAIDPELSVVSSALALGIPAVDLPCIVVFREGTSDFCWFGTDALVIEQQLERLALAANNIEPVNAFSSGGLYEYLDDYKIELRSSSVKEGLSVAGQLATNLAPSLTDLFARRDALRDAQQAIEVRKCELKELLKAESFGAEDRLRKVTTCALRLGMAIAMKNGGTTKVDWPWPSRCLWQSEAAASLATAMKLSTMTAQLETLAPIVMCYGRSFEVEINASVVQGLRQKKGVLMPEYFCKHQSQPGISAWVDISHGNQTKSIDLNAKRDKRWFPPGLGQSEKVAETLGGDGLLESTAWDTLLQQWTVIRHKRNSAAHDGLVKEETVKACHDALSKLQSEKVLDAVFALKARLKGGAER